MSHSGPAFARLTPAANALAFASSYDRDLVADLKASIPANARRWDPENKVWLVSPQYGRVCADLAMRHLGVAMSVPSVAATVTTSTRLVKLEYLGQAKDRGDSILTAFGYANGSWSLVFPVDVLRRWFEATEEKPNPASAVTLYGVLGVAKTAGPEEIKKAYRRAARTYHPDVNKEPDAEEQFKVINHAYSVLSDSNQRGRYDAGLAFAATQQPHVSFPQDISYGYRTPLRCGWVLVEGIESVGRFVVSRIVQWEDVTDQTGRVMVSSWPVGADTLEVNWI
jgi:DnaJ-domain-containing protein 1